MGGNVKDCFNMYLGYLQRVSWCTNIWFMFMHIDVTIGYITFCLATGYTNGTVFVKVSHCHTNVENSGLCLDKHH